MKTPKKAKSERSVPRAKKSTGSGKRAGRSATTPRKSEAKTISDTRGIKVRAELAAATDAEIGINDINDV
jgi:hypothetical protein